MPVLLGLGALALGAFGYAAGQTGEAVDKTSNATLKIVVGLGVGYIVAKKLKVI